jgi:hypothetical protein
VAAIILGVALIGVSAFFYKYATGSAVPTTEQLYDIEYWKTRVDKVGANIAYQEAVAGVPAGESLRTYHSVGHLVGAAIYERVGLDGITACDSRTVFGCFHEIVRLYMYEHPKSDLKALGDRCDQMLGRISWMCKHSIGHGLILENGRTLEGLRTSLTQCDSVSTLDYMESCHAGAFMEYDYDMTIPGDMQSARPIENDNWYSPCRDVDDAYASQCLRRRPYWWIIAMTNMPLEDKYARMMSLCRDAPFGSEAKKQCIQAIGIQIALIEGDSDEAHTR